MKTRGFTLIELVVVIAIVAILIGILIPALGQARRSARQVKCMSNVRSLQMAQALYADANKGFLVDVGLAHGGSGDETLSWVTTLIEYYGAPISVVSPGDRSAYWPVELGGRGLAVNGKHRRTSYGMNNWLSRTYNPGLSEREPFDRLEKIPTPFGTVQFLVMTEEGDFAVSDHTHVENWGNAARAPVTASGQVYIHKWGGPAKSPESVSNYGFLDGHAAAMKFVRVYRDPGTNMMNPEIAN